jgi:hypothetical protein
MRTSSDLRPIGGSIWSASAVRPGNSPAAAQDAMRGGSRMRSGNPIGRARRALGPAVQNHVPRCAERATVSRGTAPPSAPPSRPCRDIRVRDRDGSTPAGPSWDASPHRFRSGTPDVEEAKTVDLVRLTTKLSPALLPVASGAPPNRHRRSGATRRVDSDSDAPSGGPPAGSSKAQPKRLLVQTKRRESCPSSAARSPLVPVPLLPASSRVSRETGPCQQGHHPVVLSASDCFLGARAPTASGE